MKTLTVSKEVWALIRAHAVLPFREGSHETLPNGDKRFEVEDDTYEELIKHQFPGETISDLLVRAFAELNKQRNN